MKREEDPLNVLGCECPLLGDNDPRIQNRGVGVICCGRRCAGKDWTDEVTKRKLLDNTDGAVVATVSISDETKYAYAKEDPSVNADLLIFDRHYKKKHGHTNLQYTVPHSTTQHTQHATHWELGCCQSNNILYQWCYCNSCNNDST
jgi:hypothetical protein